MSAEAAMRCCAMKISLPREQNSALSLQLAQRGRGLPAFHFCSLAVKQHKRRRADKRMAAGEFAPDRREDIHTQHLPRFPVGFQPVHDRPDRQAGNSIIGVELDQRGLASAEGGFVILD